MNKKAFEIQFNWLFVLVAGAAILLLFTGIVVKQKNISDESTKATLLKSIDSIIIGAGVSTDTTTKIPIPNADIEVNCGRISAGAVSRQYQNLILFAPSLLKGDKLITQTMTLGVPYKATNLLFITSPQVRYILVGSTSLAKEVNKSLPSELKKELYETLPTNITNENNYRLKFVFFDSSTEVGSISLINFQKIPDEDVTAVKFEGDIEKGRIKFYQKKKSLFELVGEPIYLGKSSLIGAVYTDKLELYECSMQNVFSKINLITKIYIERTNKLKGTVGIGLPKCGAIYTDALTYLNNINSKTSSEFKKQSKNGIDDIVGCSKKVSEKNNNAQINSCPLIY